MWLHLSGVNAGNFLLMCYTCIWLTFTWLTILAVRIYIPSRLEEDCYERIGCCQTASLGCRG